jgi:NAD(P)H-hydrate epimerase
VYLHGLAGDIAAREKTEQALLACDLIESLPAALKKVKA